MSQVLKMENYMNSEPNFEFYVLNYDPNAKKVILFNIFRNINVYGWALRLTKKRARNRIKDEEYRKELLDIIQWQEWSRREYEISVGDAFEKDCTKLEKWDCYDQAEPNIEFIADMCLKRYREWKKAQKKNEV